ncbi:MAG TPA: CAP domain-containing protein [Solirubrobacteraceae bacterium]|nr:CAP domain-containing protein [Solirubrobacteraceae bacterium]
MRTIASLALVGACLVAWLTITPAPAKAGKASMNARERAVVRSINRQRAHHGLGQVRASGALARAADYHSWEMLDANYFAHESRNGGPFDARVRRFTRRRALGETLAMLGGGCRRGMATRVVRMWMNSPGHRAILLSSSFRRVGIGARAGSLGSGRACVVTADFASRR